MNYTYVCPWTWPVFQYYQLDRSPSRGNRSLEFCSRSPPTLHPCRARRPLQTTVHAYSLQWSYLSRYHWNTVL